MKEMHRNASEMLTIFSNESFDHLTIHFHKIVVNSLLVIIPCPTVEGKHISEAHGKAARGGHALALAQPEDTVSTRTHLKRG